MFAWEGETWINKVRVDPCFALATLTKPGGASTSSARVKAMRSWYTTSFCCNLSGFGAAIATGAKLLRVGVCAMRLCNHETYLFLLPRDQRLLDLLRPNFRRERDVLRQLVLLVQKILQPRHPTKFFSNMPRFKRFKDLL